MPMFGQFVRTIDLEGGGYLAGSDHGGAQYVRVEARNLDPEEMAFVGMLTTFTHFNEDLVIGKSPDSSTASFLGNWGADIGIVRGKHLWALDLMGASLGNHLAFSPAFVGEHDFAAHWKLYHRTTIDLFVGVKDTILDSDQGFQWNPWPHLGITLGYRIFASERMNRNGPRAGIVYRFQSPKIPFIFPSLG